jgi:hypothetical protein
MKVIFPRNFGSDRPHPVVVHVGGGQGDINGAACNRYLVFWYPVRQRDTSAPTDAI